jgi:hypothetical protein
MKVYPDGRSSATVWNITRYLVVADVAAINRLDSIDLVEYVRPSIRRSVEQQRQLRNERRMSNNAKMTHKFQGGFRLPSRPLHSNNPF